MNFALCLIFLQILINGTSVIENATITGFSVVAAALPIAPSPPFIPPEFENATINGEPAVTPVEEITTPRPPPGGDPSTGEGESLQYTIPAAMRVTMEPQEEVTFVCTGHHLAGEGDCSNINILCTFSTSTSHVGKLTRQIW